MEVIIIDTYSEETVINTMKELHQPGEVREIRILNTNKGTLSGYYDDLDKMVEDISEYDGKYNIFFTINPVKPDLLARAENRLINRPPQTTSDNDIERIVFLPVDIDPERPSGISATKSEKKEAWNLALKIRKYLSAKGWPEAIVADSGNGFHLLYDVDLPNNPDSRQLLQSVLQALDLLFSTEKVKVDITTFNPSRILKLYGTMACKGDNTKDRPHRRSKIISLPDHSKCVTQKQLQELVNHLPEPPKTKATKRANSSQNSFDLQAWLEKHGLNVAASSRWQNKGQKYILEKCPWNEDHTDRSAYIIQFDNGALCAGCHHNSCSNENWKSLKDKMEPGGIIKAFSDNRPDEEETPSDKLIRLGNQASFFKSPLNVAYAAFLINNHNIIAKVKSNDFKMWLRKQYYEETDKAPSQEAMNNALGIMEMEGLFSEKIVPLFRRIAEIDGTFYYDLTDDAYRVVKISGNGYELLSNPPLLFERGKNAKAQAEPDFPGDINLLWNHFQFKSKDDRILFTAYLISCFVPSIPHPVLVLSGEKGSAKSTTERMLKAIVDPAVQDLLTMPNSRADLAIILSNNYMAAFDNLDFLSGEKSDLLCMASTGGSFSKRALYSDDEEVLLTFKRCIVLNGINIVATRADLLDRSIILELNRIKEETRKEESIIWQDFNRDLPAIIGAILSTLSKAMEIFPSVQLTHLPRMADFTRWGYAITEALGQKGEVFLKAYQANQNKSNEETLASHPVASAIIALMEKKDSWDGSVSTLLDALESTAAKEKINTNSKSWPKAAHILSRRLKEVKSNLESVGITYAIRHAGNTKNIKITKLNRKK